MTYQEGSIETKWGRFAETYIREYFKNRGQDVFLTAESPGGAGLLHGPLGNLVTPDMMKFDPHPVWVEAKYKTSPVFFQKMRAFRHGIDLDNFHDYMEVCRRTEMPGYLAIYQYKPSRESLPNPMLLLASFEYLGQYWSTGTGKGDSPMAYWNIDCFEVLYCDRQLPPDWPTPAKIIHPWEKKASTGEAPKPDFNSHQLHLFRSNDAK